MIDWTSSPPFGRRISLQYALEKLLGKGIPNPLIVEIGTSESYSPLGLGNALLAFTWYAKKFKSRVLSVDIERNTIMKSRDILKQYLPDWYLLPRMCIGDAREWACTHDEPIHLLYMDGPEDSSFYVELYSNFKASCFESGSLMLWDDTQPEGYKGKGFELIPMLIHEGWKQIYLASEPVFPMVLLEK